MHNRQFAISISKLINYIVFCFVFKSHVCPLCNIINIFVCSHFEDKQNMTNEVFISVTHKLCDDNTTHLSAHLPHSPHLRHSFLARSGDGRLSEELSQCRVSLSRAACTEASDSPVPTPQTLPLVTTLASSISDTL